MGMQRISPPVGVSASNSSVSSGTVVFSNSNGVAFGLNGSTVTASYTVPTVPAQFTGGFSTGGNTAGNTGLVTGQVVLAGGPNITLSGSTNGGTITISVSGGAGAAGNTGFISAGGATASLGTVVFSNSNGVGFGVNGQTVTASHNGLTSQSNQNVTAANGGFAFQTLSLSNANGISFGTSAGSAITASHNALTSQSNQAFSADASSTFQTLSLQDSNGISFSNNAGAIRLTHALQFTSNTSAITSNALHTSASRVFNVIAATNNTGGGTASLSSNVSFSAANGITFYTSAGNAVAASYTVPTVTNSSMSVSDAATSGTLARLAFTNLNGMTLSLSTGAGGSHTIVGSYTVPTVTNSSMSVSDAATSGTLARLAFTNLNGVTLSLSTGAGGSHTIVGSHNALTSQSNQNVTAANGGFAFQTLSFSNANGVSFGTSAGSAITGSIGQTLTAYALSNTTQSTTGTMAFSSLQFAGAGIVSVGVTGGSVVISASGGGAGLSAGMSTNGNTSGDTGLVTGRFALIGGNNITLSGSTNGGSMSITISAPNLSAGAMSAGVSNLGNTAGSTGITGTQMVLVGSGVVSLSQSTGANGGTVSINVPGTSSLSATGWASISVNGSTISIGASTTVNVYAAGNTTGTSSGTVDIRTVSMRGLGGVYVGASDSGFVVSRPLDYDYEPVPSGIAGANTAITNAWGLGSQTSGGVLLWPVDVGDYVAAQYLNLCMSVSFSTLGNSSGQQTGRFHYGLYTRGAGASTSILSLLTSHSYGWSVTGNNSSYTISYPVSTSTNGFTHSTTASAGVNVTSQFTGAKLAVLPIVSTLTPGMYWLAMMQTVSTSSIIVGISQSVFGVNIGTTLNNLAPFGSLTSAYTGTNADAGFGGPWRYGIGSWTTAGGNALPNSIGINSITKGGLTNLPFMRFWSNQ